MTTSARSETALSSEHTHDPNSTASAQDSPSAENVKPADRHTPDPFGIAGDYAAGVHLLESRQSRQMQLKFDAKPPQIVLDALKDCGYRWHPNDQVWAKQMTKETAYQTRIEAERLYQECLDAILDERGASPSR